jgi:hypothetical protein
MNSNLNEKENLSIIEKLHKAVQIRLDMGYVPTEIEIGLLELCQLRKFLLTDKLSKMRGLELDSIDILGCKLKVNLVKSRILTR